MNRRDFVKAVAGIPLLGWLARMPEAEEIYVDCTSHDPDFADYVDVKLSGGFVDTYPLLPFALNDESRYFLECATEMGRAARQRLEEYVLGNTCKDD